MITKNHTRLTLCLAQKIVKFSSTNVQSKSNTIYTKILSMHVKLTIQWLLIIALGLYLTELNEQLKVKVIGGQPKDNANTF